MDTKLIDEKIEEVESLINLDEGTVAILGTDVVSWLKEIREQILNNQKYTVQVFPGEYGYLNFVQGDRFSIHSSEATDVCQTYFTQSEIDYLKKKHDLAIDWDKVIIEPVRGEG